VLLFIILKIDMKHFSEQYSVLVLDLAKAFHVLHLFFVIVLYMSRLGRRPHVDTCFHVAKSLNVHYMLFNPLSFADETIRPSLVPH